MRPWTREAARWTGIIDISCGLEHLIYFPSREQGIETEESQDERKTKEQELVRKRIK